MVKLAVDKVSLEVVLVVVVAVKNMTLKKTVMMAVNDCYCYYHY